MGKIHNALSTFVSSKRELKDIDIQLLKGFYVSTRQELEHEEDKLARKEVDDKSNKFKTKKFLD